MKTSWKPTALVVATALTLPALAGAQTNQELLDLIRSLQNRVQQLEQQLQQRPATPATPAAGMTPDELADYNRLRAKVEAIDDARVEGGFLGLKITGMVDPTFIWTQRQGSSFSFLNDFDGDDPTASSYYAFDNSFFGQAMLDIQKQTEAGVLWRLTLSPRKNATLSSLVHEATVTLPLGHNRALYAGVFPDWGGYEYYFSHEQPLITHNLLFDFTLPTAYTGMVLQQARGNWEFNVGLANIDTPRIDKDLDGRSFGLIYRADYEISEFSGFGVSGVHGKYFGESAHMLHVDGWYLRGDWSMQGHFTVGSIDGFATNGGRAQWVGLSGLLGYQLTPRLQALLRADVLYNRKNGGGVIATLPDGRNGFGPAYLDPDGERGVNRYALSAGLRYDLNESTVLKAEYRLDRATGPVFAQRDGGLRRSTHLFATSIVVTF